MGSLVINVSSDENQAYLNQIYKLSSTKPKDEAIALKKLFRDLGCGRIRATVDVGTSANQSVKASGSFTLVSAIATDAITIGTVTMTATSTPTLATDWEIDGADDDADAAALSAAINAHATLSKLVTASVADNVVTVTCNVAGSIGNQIPISSADATITASGTHLENGAGGLEQTATQYAMGL